MGPRPRAYCGQVAPPGTSCPVKVTVATPGGISPAARTGQMPLKSSMPSVATPFHVPCAVRPANWPVAHSTVHVPEITATFPGEVRGSVPPPE